MSVKSYEVVRGYHNFLFALLEMRELETLLVKELTEAKKRTDHPAGKSVFGRWVHDSDMHRQALQHVADKLQDKTLCRACKTCMGDALAASYSRMRLLELLELGKGSLGIKELYVLAKKHIMIEGDAERRYVSMAEMTDDSATKDVLMRLSEAEKKHHKDAQQLADTIEKTYGEIVKGT